MPLFARFLMTRPSPVPRARAGFVRVALWPAVLAVAALGADRAHAASAVEGLSPQGQAALQHLLHPSAAGSAAHADAPAAASRQQVVARRGESLDRIIARTSRDSPFRVEVLREAFMRLNRGAFPRGTPASLTVGATLIVPTSADVLAIVDPQRQWSAAPAPAHAPAAAAPRTAPPAAPEADRRHWIRYP